MTTQNLEFKSILSNAFIGGLKNFFPLLIAYILWALTIWIPYLNVGTTIAMVTLPASISKGETISPTSIFDGKYRKYMGEFFLTSSLRSLIVFVGLIFMVIPGIIMGYTYMFAPLLTVDKGMNATEALTASNNMTYGNKLQIFIAFFVLSLPVLIPYLNIIYIILIGPIFISAMGYIYGTLSGNNTQSINNDTPETSQE